MAAATPTPRPLGQNERPTLFVEFRGRVTVGGQPAPDGLEIQARIQWWHSEVVRTHGGRYQGLFVSPNDWALHRGTITFHIGDSQAEETDTFDGNRLEFKNFDLTFP